MLYMSRAFARTNRQKIKIIKLEKQHSISITKDKALVAIGLLIYMVFI